MRLDEENAAGHFERPIEWVRAAFNYAEAYPEEIDFAIQDYRSITLANLKRLLSNLEGFQFPKKI